MEKSIPSGQLIPITSRSTGRYEDSPARACPKSFNIEPGLFSSSREPEPAYLPPHWSTHVHPDGQLYFSHSGMPHVVTDASLHETSNLDKVTHWISVIEALFITRGLQLMDSMEFFLRIDGENCSYYIADHQNRTLFWLQSVDTDELGIQDVVSESHLKNALTELFWIHVMHFPMHFGGVSVKDVDDLISIYTHAEADHLTSAVSTFFYNAQECSRFVDILKTARDHITDGHQTCVIARLWNIVWGARVAVHYGQEQSRQSRDQIILYDPPTGKPLISNLVSLASFRTADQYLGRLNEIFTDRFVYGDHFRTFASACSRDWKEVSCLAFGALLLHPFLYASRLMTIPATISFVLFGSSLVSSILLTHRYRSLENATAGQAFNHLSDIESETYGFLFPAFLYSIPRALFLWGLTAFFINSTYLIYLTFGPLVATGTSLLFIFSFLLGQSTLSAVPWVTLRRPSGFLPHFTAQKEADDVSNMV